jgi:hypothetical protein
MRLDTKYSGIQNVQKVYVIPNILHSRHTPEDCIFDLLVLNGMKEGSSVGYVT